MADYTPNEGESEVQNVLLGKIAQPTLFIGLMKNTVAHIQGLGDTVTWANIIQVTNVTPACSGATGGTPGSAQGVEWQFGNTSWTTSGTGNPSTHPQIEWTAGTGGAGGANGGNGGGANTISGYYIRTSNNKLICVGLNPEVEASGTLKTALEGAKYRVDPTLGTS